MLCCCCGIKNNTPLRVAPTYCRGGSICKGYKLYAGISRCPLAVRFLAVTSYIQLAYYTWRKHCRAVTLAKLCIYCPCVHADRHASIAPSCPAFLVLPFEDQSRASNPASTQYTAILSQQFVLSQTSLDPSTGGKRPVGGGPGITRFSPPYKIPHAPS